MQIRQSLLLLALLILMLSACSGSDNTGAEAVSGDNPSALATVKERGFKVAGTFDAPGHMTGYTGRLNGEPTTVYVTQNGGLALVGKLFNGSGENVGRQALLAQVIRPHAKRMWSKLADSTWVAEGTDDAPQTLYVFTDPNCPYCHIFWRRIQPWIKAGEVQVRYIMVGVITRSSPNKAAAILTAPSPVDALVKNHHNFGSGGISPMKPIPADVHSKLIANVRLMQVFGLGGTPGIVYRSDNGRLQRWRGVPSKAQIASVLGALNSHPS